MEDQQKEIEELKREITTWKTWAQWAIGKYRNYRAAFSSMQEYMGATCKAHDQAIVDMFQRYKDLAAEDRIGVEIQRQAAESEKEIDKLKVEIGRLRVICRSRMDEVFELTDFIKTTETALQKSQEGLYWAAIWLKRLYDEGGDVSHEDPGCPEDDTCKCDNIKGFNLAVRLGEKIDADRREAAIRGASK